MSGEKSSGSINDLIKPIADTTASAGVLTHLQAAAAVEISVSAAMVPTGSPKLPPDSLRV